MTATTMSLADRVAEVLGYGSIAERTAMLAQPTSDIPVFGSIIRGQIALEERRLAKERMVPLIVECWQAATPGRQRLVLANKHPGSLYMWREVARLAAAGEDTHRLDSTPRLVVKSQAHPRFPWLVDQTHNALSTLDTVQLRGVFQWGSPKGMREMLEDLVCVVDVHRRFGGPFTSRADAAHWCAAFLNDGYTLLAEPEVTDDRDRGLRRTRQAGNIRAHITMTRTACSLCHSEPSQVASELCVDCGEGRAYYNGLTPEERRQEEESIARYVDKWQ
jgi:hypothetical protein